MATCLLDSSVIIDVITGKRDREKLLKDLVQAGHVLTCCPINITEVYAGVRPHEENRTTELLEALDYYPVSFPIARLAGELQNQHRKKGISLATADVTIVAVAIYNELALITDNVKHYPMREISLYPLPRR